MFEHPTGLPCKLAQSSYSKIFVLFSPLVQPMFCSDFDRKLIENPCTVYPVHPTAPYSSSPVVVYSINCMSGSHTHTHQLTMLYIKSRCKRWVWQKLVPHTGRTQQPIEQYGRCCVKIARCCWKLSHQGKFTNSFTLKMQRLVWKKLVPHPSRTEEPIAVR